MLRARLAVASGFVALSIAAAGCHDEPGDTSSESALNSNPKTGDFVVEAENSVRLQSGGLVVRGGDIGVHGASGPFLSGGAGIDVLGGVWFQSSHSMLSDSVRLEWGSVVGSIQTNHLTGGNRGWHGKVGPFIPIPALPAAATPAPGTASLTVAAGGTSSASPGAFGSVSVGNGGKLRLPAGSYDFADLSLGNGARIEAQGAVQIHVANRLAAKNGVFIGGGAGAGLTARGVRLEVAGHNGDDGSLDASPKAAAFGRGARVSALVLVPNGTLLLGDDSDATGAFFARDVDVGGSGSHVTFQDGFPAGAPPTCATSSCDDGNPCTADACDASGACKHTPVAIGTSCGDGNACNGAETCDGAGSCRSGTPVTCAASDQCHAAGVCDPTTGACSNPVQSDGAACDDGNACTRSDSCQAGVCVGANPVVCGASDQCHAAGTCNPASGICSNPARSDGAACNDGDACTQSDSCQAGVCVGANPVVCAAADQCHLAGSCDGATGVCSNPAKADGSSCDDGNSCTAGDMCMAGACMPGTASCDSIAIVEKVSSGNAYPLLSNTLAADRTLAVPGDAVLFTSNVTNLGTNVNLSGEIDLTNKGSSTFTVAGYQQTIEYLSVATNGWVPVAKIAFDATGAVVPDPTTFAFSWGYLSPINGPGVVYGSNPVNPIVGTTISAGAMAAWSFGMSPVLPGDVVSTIFDPTKASQVRVAIRFDTTSGPLPAPGSADLASILAGITGRIENPAVAIAYSGGAAGTLTPATPGPIAPGATLAFSGTLPASLVAPKGATETDAGYINRIWFNTFFGYFVTSLATGHAVGIDPPSQSAGLSINIGIPVVTISSGAPTLGNGGLTSTYDVALSASMGTADAGPFSLDDAVNGVSVPTIISAPPVIAAGASGTASVTIATPMGPYTNTLTLTWQDRNGNVYGPISFSE